MQPRQIQIIRASFAAITATPREAGALFYNNLFAADPTLQQLFRGDIAQQGERLITMIGSALTLLDRPATLLPVLRQLGARHAGYGVVENHYAIVGGALLCTLEQALGAGYTAEVRQAWTDLYGIISSTMIDAARRETVAA